MTFDAWLKKKQEQDERERALEREIERRLNRLDLGGVRRQQQQRATEEERMRAFNE